MIQVTDDTVSIQKSVLNEILTKPTKENDAESTMNNAILDVALSDTGSKLFLMLLVKDVETRLKYFDPYERSILEPIATIKENGSEVPTSKKDPETRRNELLKHIKDPLIEACTENVRELLNSLPGARVLKEVYASAPSEKLAEAIVDVCVASLDDATNANAGKKKDAKEDEILYSVFESPIGHRSIKNLILCDEESTKPFVSKLLVDRLGKRLPEIVGSNRGAFVAAALCKVPSVKDAVKKTFNSKKKDIEAKSKSKGSTAGYAALLKEMSS